MSVNKQLRDTGWLPVKWPGTLRRFKELGIPTQDRADARTAFSEKANVGAKSDEEKIAVRVGSHWGPRWAVLVAEAEPCNETAREWALEKAATDTDFRDALETIASLADTSTAKQRMADYLMELWTPEEEPRGQKTEDR